MKKTRAHRPMQHVVDALTLHELCHFCRTESHWIVELVDHGVLEPEGETETEWAFFGTNIARARKAENLRRDLGLNAAGVALVLDLLHERDVLLRRLAQYEMA